MSAMTTHRWVTCFLLLLAFALSTIQTEAARVIGKMEVGDRTFFNVTIMKAEPDAITIRHREGIAKIPLELLSPEWQEKLNYDAEKAEAWQKRKQAVAEKAREQAEKAKAKRNQELAKAPDTTLADKVLPLFGTKPDIAERVDLRPQYRELGLYAKDQGRRPSCAVFSVISALEYQQARNNGSAEKLSEEYLIWATRKSLGMAQASGNNDAMAGDADLGFSLMEVVQALRAYGVAASEDMPNTFGKNMAEIDEPDANLVADAKARRQVTAYQITGRSNDARLGGIIHLLNEKVPVVIGMAWPHYRTISRSPLISKQTPRPGAGHAITLVGYKSDTGKVEDARFQFKNSWGPQWGNGGYGWVTYPYLQQHLQSAVFLDCN